MIPGQSVDWASRRCVACEGGVRPLTKPQALMAIKTLSNWMLAPDAKSVSIDFIMKNFASAVDLIGEIAIVAEAENHHPDIHLVGYRNLRVELSTHAIGGLSENDFIVAAKINGLPKELKSP